jgi:hypothetical protein
VVYSVLVYDMGLVYDSAINKERELLFLMGLMGLWSYRITSVAAHTPYHRMVVPTGFLMLH